jgi:transposase
MFYLVVFLLMTIETLLTQIKSLKEELNSKDQQIQTKDQQIHQQNELISQLKDNLLLLQRKKFAPTSEQFKDEPQLLLFDELENTTLDEVNDKEEIEVKAHTKTRGKRKPFPEQLPRKEVIYDLLDSEKEGMKCIGEERSEKLDIIPAKIQVIVTIRKKYASIDGDGTIKTAVAPKELLPKSIAGSSLIAYIITSKYVDALPLYRQEKIFERISADLNRSSMARWMIKVSEQLVPLYNLLEDICLEQNHLQMDETRVQVLKEDGKKATSKSYMWVRRTAGENPIVLYDYDATRSGEVPLKLLDGFKGILQVDGYDGYSKVCDKNNLIRAGCWDHARRKFFDASKSSKGKGTGKKIVNILKKVYKIEDQIKNLSLDERYKIRQDKIKSILDDLKKDIDELRVKVTPDSLLGKAINYTYNEWKYLTVFLDHPEVPISNILIENAIRPFAIGRKNWLFSDTVNGAKASAMYYSIIETAKANGFEPFDYLSKMLDKLPQAETLEDYQRLLPFKDQFLI